MVLDAILALALSALLVGLLSYSTLTASSMYERAVAKKMVLNTYQAHSSEFSNLMPGDVIAATYYGTSTPAVTVVATARWYGNDRVETDIEASSSNRSVQFRAIRRYPLLSDIDSAGTPLCSPEYKTIASIQPVMLPIDASLPLTDLQVRNGIAYITSDSNKQPDPDVFIVDIRDPGHPHLLSSINTGPGLAAVAIAQNYIYAAAASTAAQIHVIRMNSLASLQLVTKYQLPLPEASTSPPAGTAIFYSLRKIYLGTEKWDGQEFSMIDMRSPENPAFLGGIETGSKVNAITVRNGIAYIADSDQNQLRTVDVYGSVPILRSTFAPSGWQRQEGVSIADFENDLGFGRTSGGFDIAADKEGFFWPHSTSIPFVLNNPGGLYGMIVSRSSIFAITHSLNQELSIFDRTFSTTSVTSYSLPVLPQSITCDVDKIYILARTAPAIYEVTFR